MRVAPALVVFAAALLSVQCLEQRYVRDVSELYSSPNVQTRPIYRPPSAPQEDLGYDYPKPAPNPQPLPPIVRPAPRPEIIVQPQPSYPQPVYPQPQPQPVYPQPQPQPVYPQPRPQPTYPQPRPVYPQPQPQPVYPQPQPVYPQPQPTYPQPQVTFPQPRPIYPEPQPVYPQPQPQPLPQRPVPAIPAPEIISRPSNGYDYPNPYAVDRVQPTGAATGTSEKIFWPFTNKFGPPSNSYPGSNNIGYPNGNYPHKFSFLDSLFPFKNNYNGQRIEASSNQVQTTSNLDGQGFNSIGNTAPSSLGGVNGYDYPNPNVQRPPFELSGVAQFRSTNK